MKLIQENKLNDPHDSGILSAIVQSKTPEGKFKFETVDGKYSAIGDTFKATLNELEILVREQSRLGIY